MLGSTDKFRRLGRAGRPDAAGRPHLLQRRFARQVNAMPALSPLAAVDMKQGWKMIYPFEKR